MLALSHTGAPQEDGRGPRRDSLSLNLPQLNWELLFGKNLMTKQLITVIKDVVGRGHEVKSSLRFCNFFSLAEKITKAQT